MIACALTRSGLRVGLYTSPHLVDVRERMLVDGRPISEDAFAQWTNMLADEIEEVGASFFEACSEMTFIQRGATELVKSWRNRIGY